MPMDWSDPRAYEIDSRMSWGRAVAVAIVLVAAFRRPHTFRVFCGSLTA